MAYRLSISVASRGSRDREKVFDQVRAADEGGVDTAWVAESWGEDAFTLMTQMVDRTTRLNIGSGIVNVFSRTPAAIAQHFGTLDVVSGGRMVIGLGTSGANVIEHFHGMPFERPLDRMREYVDVINVLMRGEPLNFEGEFFQMNRGFTLRFERERDHIPVYLATLAPKSLQITAEVADGWLPIWTPIEALPGVTKAFRERVVGAGREADAVTVRSPGGVVFTKDVERARAAVAGNFAFYMARMGVFYHRHLSRLGYSDVADQVRAAWNEGGSSAGAAAVPPQLQQSLTLVTNSVEAARERFAAEEAAGIQLHSVSVDIEDVAERRRVYESLTG